MTEAIDPRTAGDRFDSLFASCRTAAASRLLSAARGTGVGDLFVLHIPGQTGGPLSFEAAGTVNERE